MLLLAGLWPAALPAQTSSRATASDNVTHPINKPAETRPKVALVISGGGAKGAAAIGALKYVEKAGIPIDLIVGTSAGSIVGGLYCCGYNAQQLDSIFRATDWPYLLMDFKPTPRQTLKERRALPSLMNGDRFKEKIDSLTGHRSCHFDELPIPLRCMSVDVTHFCEVCLDSGNVASAIRASMSVPILWRAVRKDSMELIDGGLLNNLPVDVARKLGADYVIAIDLMDAKRAEQETRRPIHSYGLPAVLAWQYARPDLNKYRTNRLNADILIHPDVSGFSGSSFGDKDTETLINRGEKAGREAWASLMVLKQKLERYGIE